MSRSGDSLADLDRGIESVFWTTFLFALFIVHGSKLSGGDYGCGYLVFSALTSGALAAVVTAAVDQGVRIWHKRKAADIKPRWLVLKHQLRQSSPNCLRMVGQSSSVALREADRHLADIRSSLMELARLTHPQRVLDARRELLARAVFWLTQKQQADAKLLYVEFRRWSNALEPLRPNRVSRNAQQLAKTLSRLAELHKEGETILEGLIQRIWPGCVETIIDSVTALLRDCDEVEQVLRRRTIDLTLEREDSRPILEEQQRSPSLFFDSNPQPSEIVPIPPKLEDALNGAMSESPVPPSPTHSERPTGAGVKAWEREIGRVVGAAVDG